MDIKIIKIRTKSADEKGSLSFLEASKDIDFEIKRFYYTYGATVNTQRGGHAHRTLRQILFCPYGEIKIILDDGLERAEILLDSPEKGLIVEERMWHEMIWLKENSVLCVAASDWYEESDYIRNYDEFIAFLKNEARDED